MIFLLFDEKYTFFPEENFCFLSFFFLKGFHFCLGFIEKGYEIWYFFFRLLLCIFRQLHGHQHNCTQHWNAFLGCFRSVFFGHKYGKSFYAYEFAHYAPKNVSRCIEIYWAICPLPEYINCLMIINNSSPF